LERITVEDTTNMSNTHKDAKALARKYRSAQDYQDLYQEGILASLELEQKGVTDPKKIKGGMRRAMNDYKNYKDRLVVIPSSGASRKAMAAMGTCTTATALQQALSSPYGVSLEDCSLKAPQDTAKDYEEADFLQKVLLVLEDSLDSETYDMVVSFYVKGEAQESIALRYGVHQQKVSKVLQTSVEKARVLLGE